MLQVGPWSPQHCPVALSCVATGTLVTPMLSPWPLCPNAESSDPHIVLVTFPVPQIGPWGSLVTSTLSPWTSLVPQHRPWSPPTLPHSPSLCHNRDPGHPCVVPMALVPECRPWSPPYCPCGLSLCPNGNPGRTLVTPTLSPWPSPCPKGDPGHPHTVPMATPVPQGDPWSPLRCPHSPLVPQGGPLSLPHCPHSSPCAPRGLL